MRKEGGVVMICDVDTGTVDELILLLSSTQEILLVRVDLR